MTAPTPPPKYIYKILPSAPPADLPDNLPLSALDARDGFLHMSTSRQILGTLRNFFDAVEKVWILRVGYSVVEKHVKWEDAKGLQPDEKGGCWDTEGKAGFFPHIYADASNGDLQLGKQEVESVGVWTRGADGWSADVWCFEEDTPIG